MGHLYVWGTTGLLKDKLWEAQKLQLGFQAPTAIFQGRTYLLGKMFQFAEAIVDPSSLYVDFTRELNTIKSHGKPAFSHGFPMVFTRGSTKNSARPEAWRAGGRPAKLALAQAPCGWCQIFSMFVSWSILVGGLEHVLFFHILGIIIPIDFHIFQMGWNHQPEYLYEQTDISPNLYLCESKSDLYPWNSTKKNISIESDQIYFCLFSMKTNRPHLHTFMPSHFFVEYQIVRSPPRPMNTNNVLAFSHKVVPPSWNLVYKP